MADKDFDPLEESIKIAKGEFESGEEHEALNSIMQIVEDWKELAEEGKPIPMEELDGFQGILYQILSNHIPLEIREKHILNLIKYVYPALKSAEVNVNHSGEVEVEHKGKVVLSEKAAKFFNDTFDTRV